MKTGQLRKAQILIIFGSPIFITAVQVPPLLRLYTWVTKTPASCESPPCAGEAKHPTDHMRLDFTKLKFLSPSKIYLISSHTSRNRHLFTPNLSTWWIENTYNVPNTYYI